MDEEPVATESSVGLTTGAVIASALAAAAVAFLLRRALHEETTERKEAAEAAEPAAPAAAEAALRQRATAAAGDFLRSQLGPELKPMLLTVLKDVKEYVDRGFQRAEQAIREF